MVAAPPLTAGLEDRLHFETLVDDLSARLVAASDDADFPAIIHAALAERLTAAGRLQAAVDVAGLGFLEMANGRLTYLDVRSRDLFDVTTRDVEDGRAVELWAERLHPDDRGRVLDLQARVASGGLDREEVTYRYLHPARGVIWVQHMAHVLVRRPDGRPQAMSGVVRDITADRVREEALRTSHAEAQRLREQLERENVYLRQQTRALKASSRIGGQSRAIRTALMEVERVAPTQSTVLLLGETGTGKELFAAAIHEQSPRRGRAMVQVNCAAIPVTLIESELFGRERGAYTGALSRQVGRFELANGSTIFLDEIGDLPLDIQVKLLRVLQERQIERLGNPRPLLVDVRIIAATHHDLERDVREGRFREDLYYRLSVFPVHVPALRERREDIPLLVESLVEELAGTMGKRIESVSRASLDALVRHDWPGNVRELRNAVERALILASGPVLHIDIPGATRVVAPAAQAAAPGGLDPVEVLKVLEEARWRIRGRDGAAERLGVRPTTLESRMARLGIRRP